MLGRFGPKVKSPSLRLQAASAYQNDIGVTPPVFEESSASQIQDDLLEGNPEIDEETLQAMIFYVQTSAVPVWRNVASPEVQRGQLILVLDEKVCPLPGYNREECLLESFDSTQKEITWHKKSDLVALRSQPVRLRFYVKEADLYGFQIR